MQAITKTFLLNHAKQIMKDGIFQVIGVSFLIWFLLYLLHILVGLSLGVHYMSQNIQNKLGVYFYIKDNPNQQDQTYSKVIEMKDKLEKLWMKVNYVSKDEAIKSIERKVPSVLESFEKYGIKNPLPATVYVLFDNNKDYEKLKAVITLYEWIIANRDDISKIGENMKKQETRILQTLGFTRAITALSVFLIVVILIIVCAFLMLTIKTKFDAFRKMISIQQLLWTPYFLILSPFLMVISLMTILWFWLSLVLRYGTGALLQSYSSTILWSGLYDILGTSLWFILWLQGLEIVVILICVLVLGYLYLKNLLIEYSN